MLQLAIFVENVKGRLADVLNLLREQDVNIRALSLADTKDYGVLRIIVDEPEEVAAKLRARDCVVSTTHVWAIKVPDRSGGLAEVLVKLVEHGVIVEYMYSYVERANEQAQVVIRVQDEKIMAEAVRKANIEAQ